MPFPSSSSWFHFRCERGICCSQLAEKLFELEELAGGVARVVGDRINVANYEIRRRNFPRADPLLEDASHCPGPSRSPPAIKTQINIHLSSTFVLVSDKIVPERKLSAASSAAPRTDKVPFHGHSRVFHAEWAQFVMKTRKKNNWKDFPLQPQKALVERQKMSREQWLKIP